MGRGNLGLAQASLVALSVMLASCGGSDGSGVVSTPAPNPTPSPSPSPTPTPTPAANTSLQEPLVTESFTNDAVRAAARFTAASSSGAVTSGAITIRYDAVTKGYSLNTPTGTITFLPTDIDNAQSSAGAVVYSRTSGNTTDTLTLTRPGTSGPLTYQYVGGAYWQRTTQVNSGTVDGSIDTIAYGVATPTTAVPRTGQASFGVDLIGARSVGSGLAAIAGVGTMLVDFARGTVTTVGRVTSGGVQNGTANNSFSANGTLSASANSFSGNFTLEDFGRFTGTMEGRFYGPAAQEVGAAVKATYTTDLLVATLTGRRGTGAPANSQFNDLSTNINQPALANSELFSASSAQIATTLSGTSGSSNTGTFSDGSRSANPLTIFFDSTSRSYTVIAPDRTSSFFPPSYDLSLGTTSERFGEGAQTITPPNGAPITLTYSRVGSWMLREAATAGNRYRIEDFVYGIATPDASLPRSGSGNYRILLSGNFADGDFPNLTRANGNGVLEANFATGALNAVGSVDFSEDYTMSGRAAGSVRGSFDLTAQIASATNAFAGSINLSGLGAYTGTFNGRFYGPGADEVGGAFSVSDGGSGIGAGTIIGIKDANAVLPGSIVPLTSLSGPTPLANSAVIVGSSANAGFITKVSFDPTTNRYVLGFSDSTIGGGSTTDLVLDGNNRDQLASTTSQSVHIGEFRGAPFMAKVSTLGSGNPTIALTYTGYTTFDYNVPQFLTRYFAFYGIETPALSMPRTGSGTYSGIVTGYGASYGPDGGQTNNYTLSGTGTLTANFAASTIASTLSISGRTLDGNATLRDFGSFSHTGSYSGNTFFLGVNRNSLAGHFFGPAANEVAAIFGITNFATTERVELDGLFLGKRP